MKNPSFRKTGRTPFRRFAPGVARAGRAKNKKVLFFSKCSDFVHDVVDRHGQPLSYAERVLAAAGPGLGIDFTFPKDGSLFTPEYLDQFDALCFYTSGDLLAAWKFPGSGDKQRGDGNPPMTEAGKAALLNAVASGKGFIGIHSAADTFHTGENAETDVRQVRTWRYRNWGDEADPYIRMIGAELIIHGTPRVGTLRVVDNEFPGFANVGRQIKYKDEWYSMSDFSHDLHVLLVQETADMTTDEIRAKSAVPDDWMPYLRPPYPATWARMHGKGRVFYTAMGHGSNGPEAGNGWDFAPFREMLYGGIAWAVGDMDADVTPNIEQVTPEAWTLPPPSAPMWGLPTPVNLNSPDGVGMAPLAPRPRILGLANVGLFVRDANQSRQYYKGFLGFDEPLLPANVDGGPLPAWIKVNDRQFIELLLEKAAGSDRLHRVSLETDDAEAMRQYLKSKGIPVPDRTAITMSGGPSFSVEDPDGHTLEFVQYQPDGWVARDFGRHLPGTRISTVMSHCGIMVRHLDASLKFYRDILGCVETWRGSMDGKFLIFVNLRLPDGRDYIEFMLYDSIPAPIPIRSVHHVCLEVADIPGTGEKLASRPLPKDSPLPTKARIGLNNKRQINYYDPDGTRTEVMESATVDGKPAQSSTAQVPHSAVEPSLGVFQALKADGKARDDHGGLV